MTTIGARGPGRCVKILVAGTALLLNGCAGGGISPLGDSLLATMPSLSSEATTPARRAASLSYASLVLTTPDRSGLVVLGAEAGGTTLWPTGNQGAISLYHEGLAATAGLGQDLLSLRYQPLEASSQADDAYLPWRQATPVRYRVESHWRRRDGDMVTARGQAKLHCDSAKPRPLPLGARPLEICREVVSWGSDRESVSYYYRSPDDRRLWAAEVMPWPDGPALRWEVARAWW